MSGISIPPENNGADDDPFILAGRTFSSRLLVGTGKYASMAQTQAAIEASGAEIVTVALRRVNLADTGAQSLQAAIPPDRYTYLPNSAGCTTAEEAVRTLRLARELGGWTLVKLEVIGDAASLYPDIEESLKAAEILVAEGFDVMVYTTDDVEAARRFEALGVAAIMPLAAPIGSGLGIRHPERIRRIVAQARIPVLVDAGVGTASDAAIAMELGCAGVLMNTAIAQARDPVQMAVAMRLAVESGRLAYRAGRMAPRAQASASSPQTGLITVAG
ncbi:MAG: thiazole synthase [Alphaproteobacteria bacterium]|nr:thiazole synthase [Alphaproteobacteria bacterium]